jgi:hypothetical protein
MSSVTGATETRDAGRTIVLPVDLERRLHAFRRLVWRIKSIEAVGGALFGFLLGYAIVFVLDRLMETQPAPWSRWPSTAGSGGTGRSTRWRG